MAAPLPGGPVTVARLLVGSVDPSGSDLLPEFQDLGAGVLSDLLAGAQVGVGTGGSLILIGSTDGTAADVVGVPTGQRGAEALLSLSALGVVSDTRLQAPVGGPAASFRNAVRPRTPVRGALEFTAGLVMMGLVTVP